MMHENLDDACYTWLVNAKSQNIFISATILTAKALFFGKELGCNDFHLSDGSLDHWKKKKVSLKTASGIIYKNQYLKPFLS